MLVISQRLKDARELRKLSQGDIESRTGLRRCYVSRVENGHTVPSVETLEKLARALELPLYELFYDRKVSPAEPRVEIFRAKNERHEYSQKHRHFFSKLTSYLSRMSEPDRQLFIGIAEFIAKRRKRCGPF